MLRKVSLKYAIKLHYREEDVIKGLVNFFNSMHSQTLNHYTPVPAEKRAEGVKTHIHKSEISKSIKF